MRCPVRHIFMPVEQTINGTCMQCNNLLNDSKPILQTVFTNRKNENSLIVGNFNPILGRPCVHPGTKFKVLIAYLIEINQQSDSFPLLTIIRTNKL